MYVRLVHNSQSASLLQLLTMASNVKVHAGFPLASSCTDRAPLQAQREDRAKQNAVYFVGFIGWRPDRPAKWAYVKSIAGEGAAQGVFAEILQGALQLFPNCQPRMHHRAPLAPQLPT